MSMNPEKLKQYLSLKDTALALCPDLTVNCIDPQPDSDTATVSVALETPFIGFGTVKAAIASLFSFCDAFVIATSDANPGVALLTFGVESLQKGE